MKKNRILLGSAALVVLAILAFFLQDVIRQTVVTPIAYLWWVLNLVYRVIPQLILWIILLAVLILVVILDLVKWFSIGNRYEQTIKPSLGAVETLARWVTNAREGNYYKWLIANRLGKQAREMQVRFENPGTPARHEEKEAPSRLASEAVQRYLKAGLDESFVDYPLPALPFLHRKATPFDIKVEDVVEFLESQMEVRGGQKHP